MSENMLLGIYICFAWSIVVFLLLVILKQIFDGGCDGKFSKEIDFESFDERFEAVKKLPRCYLGRKNVCKDK